MWSRWRPPSMALLPKGSSPSRPARRARTASGRRSLSTQTATGSSWSSGRLATPRASPRPTGRRQRPRKEIACSADLGGSIHPMTWKADSRNFALRGLWEVRLPVVPVLIVERGESPHRKAVHPEYDAHHHNHRDEVVHDPADRPARPDDGGREEAHQRDHEQHAHGREAAAVGGGSVLAHHRRDLLLRAAVGQALDRTSRIGYCDHRYKTEKQERFTHSMA